MKTALEFVVKLGLTFAIAAALLVPSSIKVQSANNAGGGSPSIEQINPISWFAAKPKPQTFKIDTLLAPRYGQPLPAFANISDKENCEAIIDRKSQQRLE